MKTTSLSSPRHDISGPPHVFGEGLGLHCLECVVSSPLPQEGSRERDCEGVKGGGGLGLDWGWREGRGYLMRSTSVSQDSKSLGCSRCQWDIHGAGTKVSHNQHSAVCTLLSLDILDVFFNKLWLSALISLTFLHSPCVYHST